MSSNQRNLALLGLLAVLASAPQALADVVHTATPSSIVGHYTYLDGPSFSDPSRLLLVTPTWNPTPGAGVYNDHPIGVWYDTGRRRWAIFNQDRAAMPLGASFYVYDGRAGENFFVLRCVPGTNLSSNSCYVNEPRLANGQPNVLVFATANWNPGGSGGVYNSRHTGVWYDDTVGMWAVFNQDQSAMPPNAAFNVLILRPGAGLFVHRATGTNISGNSTYLTAFAGRPPGEVGWFWVTPLFNPAGGGGGYYDRAFGVWYDANRRQWAIFNQNRDQAMPAGVAFNVHLQAVP